MLTPHSIQITPPLPEMATSKCQQNMTLPSIRSLFPHEFKVSVEKQGRSRASYQQLLVLNHTFRLTPYPDTKLRTTLSEQLRMPPRAVQIWFQNKRQATRRSQAAKA
ncbi:Short stature homeobox protein 2, partial [Massospora cicadina]